MLYQIDSLENFMVARSEENIINSIMSEVDYPIEDLEEEIEKEVQK